MPLTEPRNTDTRLADILALPVAAAAKIWKGGLTAINAAGFAVPASDTAGLKVVGLAIISIDNTDGANGAAQVEVKRGCFLLANSAANAATIAHINGPAYVIDDETVATQSTHSIPAGRIHDIAEDGSVWVDTAQPAIIPSAE
ncbi:hypothetical protein [Geminisphaera colitermitum]|uniref:hypothetical protein n=1 Tax=Geminisphaera colitermitum TaxID=1148786 RepID=UPI000158D3F4|nr:hypothetical protein [Geminisphaera colitermitum]